MWWGMGHGDEGAGSREQGAGSREMRENN